MFPFEHGDNVVLTIQNDNIYLKPGIMTIGGIDRTCVVWPLSACSRFGSTKDCFYVEVDRVLSNNSNSSGSSSSGIFCIKSHISGKILKDILKYCKSYKNKKDSKLFTSFFDPPNAKNFDPMLETSSCKPMRRKSFFQYNSIYNYDKNETILKARSILKNPKRFFTLRRTKNN